MNFLKSQPRFHFFYDEKPFNECNFTISQSETSDTLTTVYHFTDGLTVTNIATKHGDAYEWVNWFENTSDQPTAIISKLWDAHVSLPMEYEKPFVRTAQLPDPRETTMVYVPKGGFCSWDAFLAHGGEIVHNRAAGQLAPGKRNAKEFHASNGWSCEQNAPFFHICYRNQGYICAIGWSGQWHCNITREENELLFQSQIEDTHFRLLPGEKFRTSSVVIMPYQGTWIQAANKWRRLIKDHFSVLGKPGRDNYGPLCAGIWGGMQTDSVLKRIEIIKQQKLPFEYVWMDAGWYGQNTAATPDEFEGDWPNHVGDWIVSPRIHPNGLKDISRAVHDAGMKFLLWFEPERAIKGVPITKEHPEYFLLPAESTVHWLLNLGNETAWEYCFHTLVQLIEDIGVDFYRQDCNFRALLPYWQNNDTPDRRGISEIKHITGLYRLWDALLTRFPHLLIDNCAGGGRRIDIETLKRSIPLWRSDYQCAANFPVAGSQCHHITYNRWMPFSGAGSGRAYDTYRIRSCYDASLTTNYTFSERDSFGDDPDKMSWLKKHLYEYLQVRPYFSEDFYPLTEVSDRTDAWSATQFDRPEECDGIVQVFRRENSPFDTACLKLHAIDVQSDYIFTDADNDRAFVLNGAKLSEKGFSVYMPEPRSAKIYFYKKINCQEI